MLFLRKSCRPYVDLPIQIVTFVTAQGTGLITLVPAMPNVQQPAAASPVAAEKVTQLPTKSAARSLLGQGVSPLPEQSLSPPSATAVAEGAMLFQTPMLRTGCGGDDTSPGGCCTVDGNLLVFD